LTLIFKNRRRIVREQITPIKHISELIWLNIKRFNLASVFSHY
jgi:hypothetical protein